MHLRLPLFIALILLTSCTSQQATVLTDPISTNNSSSSLSSLSSLFSLSSSTLYSLASLASLPSITSSSSPTNPLPPSVKIDLPFASQAPTGNWGDPFQEACEEASMILVHHYLSKTPLDASVMNQSIFDLVEWETQNGLPQDITVTQLANVAREYYGYESEEPCVSPSAAATGLNAGHDSLCQIEQFQL